MVEMCYHRLEGGVPSTAPRHLAKTTRLSADGTVSALCQKDPLKVQRYR